MLNIIAAVSNNNAIGVNGKLPWHLKKDLQFFKSTTRYNTVVMGRKTYESIGRPLPHRDNIVISRTQQYEGVINSSIEEVLEVSPNRSIWVIGGGEIYRQFLPFCDHVYLTKVDMHVSNADTFFPTLNNDEWKEISHSTTFNENGINYSFAVYENERKLLCS